MFQVFKTRNLPGGCFKRNSVAQGECLFLLKRRFPFKTCSWPSLLRVVVSETKTKGAAARGAETGPPHGAIGVSVSSKMWVCSQWVFKLKLHQLGTKILVPVWCISAWDTRHVLLHLGSTRVLQVWGCCWKCRIGEGLEAKQKLSCEIWEGRSSLQVPQMSFRSKVKRFSVTL